MHDEFETFVTVGIKDGKGKASAEAIFRTFGGGVKTSRDVWAYNFNYEALVDNINRTIDFYNDQVYKWQNTKRQIADVDTFVINDDRQISWSRDLKADLQRGKLSEFSEDKVRKALYRPFTRSNLFFDRILNEEVYVFPSIFPVAASDVENRVFCATGVGAERPFASLMSNSIPDLNFFGPGTVPQWFPFYTYDEDGTNRRENITDWALEKFRAHYADESISKWDIFHYAYAVLHHPLYRERYAANLKRELPRLPFAPDFRAFAAAGKSLAELHVGYERQPAYPLERVEQPGAALDWRVERMKLGKDGRTLRYNEFLTLSGIPAEAFDYRLGNRSALEWIVDQYQVSTDRRSGITNDPNRADDPEYIVRLVGQVVRVSVETVKLVRSLPRLGIAEG
jgi:predicted helicase